MHRICLTRGNRMYFKDDTDYTYFLPNEYFLHGVKNVGWIDREHPFTKGISDAEFIEKLKAIILTENEATCFSVNKIRGFHKCNFCNSEMITITDGRKKGYLGMSEIWIPSIHHNEYYAFPSLIFHYITSHMYRPPEDFIVSVLNLNLSENFCAQNIYDNKIKELKIDFWFR
ncbi:hypothetical protein K4J23_004659 [Escherichia coli]|nr:hypothetical protein [Escherichia coli]